MDLAIILAAGEGTRMNSKHPKVLKKILGKSLLKCVTDQVNAAGITRSLVIVGHGAQEIIENFQAPDVFFISQPIGEGEPYGTGFAVMQALPEIRDGDSAVILCGDAPLIQSGSILKMLDAVKEGYHAAVLTAEFDYPFGYGRIVRNKDGDVERIVEEKEASPKEKRITEINSGAFAFRGGVLKDALKKISNDNQKGEFYLTDVIEVLSKEGKKVAAIEASSEEALGINSNNQLAYVSKLMQRRINERHMQDGVQIIDPDSTIISADVIIGKDTVIYPGAEIEKGSVIGEDVIIRGSSRISASQIGNGTEIESSVIEESVIGEGVKIGPFAHIRPNSTIKDKVRLGNFTEIKNSVLGKGTKVSHLTYVGDCDVGSGVNFGCGSVIVNYDGKEKHRSFVGDEVFVGCNANLISPVRVGNSSYIAAGSTITEDVGENSLAIERGKQAEIENWVIRKGLK